jgi:hypothetical protein
MSKNIYKYFPEKTIDIYGKEKSSSKHIPQDTENLALIALRATNRQYSELHESFKKKVIQLNQKVRTQPLKHVTSVIHYWLSPLTQ